jgi:hypothetical protein
MTKGVDPLEISDDYIGFFETVLSNEPARALRQPRESYKENKDEHELQCEWEAPSN